MAFEKVVIVTRKTRLEELIERFNTRAQAKFYIEHMGLDFAAYDREHDAWKSAVDEVRNALDGLLPRLQLVERTFLPNFLFTPKDVVVTVGMDGLVVNTAKYLDGQPIIAVNPDPAHIEGVLLPFGVEDARAALLEVAGERAAFHEITMGEVTTNDGQRLLAFNDFMIGQRTHVSSRYRIRWRDREEEQSSSGILVATGAGSTGWLSSTQNMADAVSHLLAPTGPPLPRLRMAWDDPRLAFVVREPWRSKASGADLAAGFLDPGDTLEIESHMPEGGVIFSDGVEADAIAFTAGSVATVRASARRARLVRYAGVASSSAGSERKSASRAASQVAGMP